MEWDYRGKVVLAPMVRLSTLPLRMLAVSYGCDIVYGDEIIDRKIMLCKRVENKEAGTIDFMNPNGPVFRTFPGEKVVFQLGSACAATALQGAQVVANDVRAIDLNMGCPQRFSMQGGMGASLLTDVARATDILTTLKRNLNIPVTCKIRLLDDVRDTIQLAQTLEKCNISAIAIHARRVQDRPRHAPLRDQIPLLVDSLSIPVIYNGDVFYHREIEELKRESKCSSVMIARGAQWNASVFRAEGMLPVLDVVGEYLDVAMKVKNSFQNTKYCALEMIKGHVGPDPIFQRVARVKSEQELRDLFPELRAFPSLSGPYTCPLTSYVERPVNGEAEKARTSSHQRKMEAKHARKAARKRQREEEQQQGGGGGRARNDDGGGADNNNQSNDNDAGSEEENEECCQQADSTATTSSSSTTTTTAVATDTDDASSLPPSKKPAIGSNQPEVDPQTTPANEGDTTIHTATNEK